MSNKPENTVINIKPENTILNPLRGMYIYALVWTCDNTPVRGIDMFTSYHGYIEDVLIPFYEPKGIRVVCISSVEEEVTDVCIGF